MLGIEQQPVGTVKVPLLELVYFLPQKSLFKIYFLTFVLLVYKYLKRILETFTTCFKSDETRIVYKSCFVGFLNSSN